MINERIKRHNKKVLRTCQLKQLQILKEIDKICQRHQITYWLDNGSLLGAVRHKGFIPWDDDMDIVMPMEDYRRFLSVAQQELPENLFVQTKETDKTVIHPITKVRDLNTFYIEAGDDLNAEYQKGIFVDITPFIDYPSILPSISRRIARGVCVAYHIIHSKHYYNLRAFAEFFYFSTKYLLFLAIWEILCTFGRKRKYLSCDLRLNGYGIIHRAEIVYPLKTILFENEQFPCPADEHQYLTDIYGDYKVIPPEEKRKIHAIYINPELDKL